MHREMQIQEKIKEQLKELAAEDYRVFSSRLLPQTPNVLGVRLPLLRRMAQQIAKGNWAEYLQTARDDSFEEIMLQGMVIGCVKCTAEERFMYIRGFVPKIDNWSVCDSFCTGLRFTKKEPEAVWAFLLPYFQSQREFSLRFAIVMLLSYYIDEAHIHMVLRLINHVRHEGYYVKMAAAWAISLCYIRFPQLTHSYLEQNALDDFTYNKALQKITESLRVDQATKERIRGMKRKIRK
jgi:3-methyladenine DNA glycosylase AlkD